MTDLETALGNLSHVLGGPVTYDGVTYQSTSNIPYEFDVITAEHDDLKDGNLGTCPKVRTRVLISKDCSYPEAMVLAAQMAVATNGGMCVEVLPRH